MARVRFRFWIVSGYAHAFILSSPVIVTLRLFTYPKKRDRFVRFMPLAQAFSKTQRRDLNPVPVPPL